MIPAKEEVRHILDQLPDDDIQYHIYIRQKVDRGLSDVSAGNTLSESEFDARIAKWLAP